MSGATDAPWPEQRKPVAKAPIRRVVKRVLVEAAAGGHLCRDMLECGHRFHTTTPSYGRHPERRRCGHCAAMPSTEDRR